MLQSLRSAIYAFKADFVVAVWIARLKPSGVSGGGACRACNVRLLQSGHSRF